MSCYLFGSNFISKSVKTNVDVFSYEGTKLHILKSESAILFYSIIKYMKLHNMCVNLENVDDLLLKLISYINKNKYSLSINENINKLIKQTKTNKN